MAVRGHHVRGAIGGLLLGIALTIMLTLYGVVRLGENTGIWVVLAGLAFGLVWSWAAPAPKAKRATPE